MLENCLFRRLHEFLEPELVSVYLHHGKPQNRCPLCHRYRKARELEVIDRLINSKGLPTNAIFGFLSTMRKLIDQERPEFLAVIFDAKGPTFRHEMFESYKANRKPMPDDLIVQIPPLKELIQAMDIPAFELSGYEADDIIGSIARQAASEGVQSVMVSTDKDLLQLIDESTLMYNPKKEAYIGKGDVREVFGVDPGQVIDVLTLWGDSSDNIPGVPGVGEKTAKNLIREFGSLEAILESPEKIKNPKLRERLIDNLDVLELSRKLVTIKRDLPIEFDLESLSLSPPAPERIIPLLKDLEFTSLLSSYIQKEDEQKTRYHTILRESDLKDLVEKIKRAGSVSLDTETDNIFPVRARLVGMSFAVGPNKAYYLPLRHDYDGAPEQISKDRAFKILSEVLASPRIKKIGQNIKYDSIVLKNEGIALEGIEEDSMVLSYLLEPNWGKHNLNRLAQHYLHVQAIPYNDITGKGKNEVTLNEVAIERVTPYACQDADLAMRLSRLLKPKVADQGLESLYKEIEIPLIPVLADMEMWGIRVDASTLEDLSSELEEELLQLKKKILEISGEDFNLNSPQQLSRILFEKLKLPPSRKTRVTKGYSTSFEVLQDLAVKYPIAQHTLEHRQLSKLKSGYADSLPLLINKTTGRIHTSYNQTVAATGRLSSSDPNLQNIPVRGEMGPRFRKAFIPEPGGMFLSADYAQIELRVLAHLSGDENLIDGFIQDRDIHTETATSVFSEQAALFPDEARRRAKIINFSIIYGTSAFSLAKELGTSPTEAQVFIDLYYERYPKVREYLDQIVDAAQKTGYSETLFGRRRQVPELAHKNRTIQQAGRRIALNTPIQGTAADLIKKAMIEIWGEIKGKGLKTRMVLQVHDELLFEVPDAEQDIVENLVKLKMEGVYPLSVPLSVHLGWGINWAEAK